MILRRALVLSALTALPRAALHAAPGDRWTAVLRDGVDDLEHRHGGRLGVGVLDTGTQRLFAHRGSERFALCSTHKLLTAACVLARVDRGQERLDRRIVYGSSKLVPYSPVTSRHVGGDGLSVAELCAAALTLSDNTAANLLLETFGGPLALTAYIRSLGDSVTRLDRWEPQLNDATPGDPRDTTTPLAMLRDTRKIMLGTTLSPGSRAQLTAWLVADKVGGRRVRAGLPSRWRVGDKTGTGDHNATNDVVVTWPPGRAPIIITVYYAEAQAPADAREAVLADVGRLVADVTVGGSVQATRGGLRP